MTAAAPVACWERCERCERLLLDGGMAGCLRPDGMLLCAICDMEADAALDEAELHHQFTHSPARLG